MFKFNINYLILAIILFGVEALIGIYAHDAFIRPFMGDLLIGVFIYCVIKSFIASPVWPTAIFTLLVCYAAETMQYFHFLNHMGWQHSKLAQIVFGTTFSWGDLLCYTIGMMMVLLTERLTRTIQQF